MIISECKRKHKLSLYKLWVLMVVLDKRIYT